MIGNLKYLTADSVAALQAKDAAVMELSSLAREIAEDAKEGKIAVLDLPDYVNRLHGVIGTLKSV